MKKIELYIFMALAILSSSEVAAQFIMFDSSQKDVVTNFCIKSGDSEIDFDFTYDNNNYPTSFAMDANIEGEGEIEETTINYLISNDKDNNKFILKNNDQSEKDLKIEFNTNNDWFVTKMTTEGYYDFAFEYDENGYLKSYSYKMIVEEELEGSSATDVEVSCVCNLEWNNGNLVKIAIEENEDDVISIIVKCITYSEIENNANIDFSLNNIFDGELDFMMLPIGKMSKYLPAKMIEYDSSEIEEDNISSETEYSYETDKDNRIIKITTALTDYEMEGETEESVFNITYKGQGQSTLIRNSQIDFSDEIAEIYSASGSKQTDIQKGVNIVRLKNGKTIKYISTK